MEQLISGSAPIPDFRPELVVPEDTSLYYPRRSSIVGPAGLVSPGTLDCELWNFECTNSSPVCMGDVASQTAIQDTRLSQRLMDAAPSPSMEISSNGAVDALLFDQPVPKARKSFAPRKVKGHQFSLNRQYVLCTLRSYPSMLLHGKKGLPPFIHPQCMVDISRDHRADQKSLPQPLANCAAIVQMWPVKNKNNVVFIWKSIRMEQERLSAEVRRSKI